MRTENKKGHDGANELSFFLEEHVKQRRAICIGADLVDALGPRTNPLG